MCVCGKGGRGRGVANVGQMSGLVGDVGLRIDLCQSITLFVDCLLIDYLVPNFVLPKMIRLYFVFNQRRYIRRTDYS